MFYTCKEEVTSLLATVRGIDKASPGTDGIPQDCAGRGFFLQNRAEVTPSFHLNVHRAPGKNSTEPSPPTPLGVPPFPIGNKGKRGGKSPKSHSTL